MKIIASAALAAVAAAIAVAGFTAGSATAVTAAVSPASPGSGQSLSSPNDALSSVACETDKDCLAVGTDASSVDPVAARWNGKVWLTDPVKLPAGAAGGSLDAVSCAPGAGSPCLATGDYAPEKWAANTDDTGLADWWNGRTWTPVAVSGIAGVELGSVSCPAANYCLAVGTYTQPIREHTKGIAYLWGGGRWTRVNPVVPHGGTSQLNSVSCTSARFCVAVGGTWQEALAYRWTGKGWVSMKPVTVKGDAYPELDGVSCVSPTYCLAVGENDDDLGYVERWNGKAWTLSVPAAFQTSEETAITAGVSCLSADYCMAIANIYEGQSGSSAGAWVWNGKKWTATAVPDDGNYTDNSFDAVNCVRATFCVAVGNYTSTYPPWVGGAQAGFWNDNRWYLDTP